MKTMKVSALLLPLAIVMVAVSPVHAQPPASPTPPTWEGLRCDELWTKAIAQNAMSKEERSKQPLWTADEHTRFFSCLQANLPGGPTLPAAPRWCPEVPETPPPPHYEIVPNGWATTYKYCSSIAPSKFRTPFEYHSALMGCGQDCAYAGGLWGSLANPPPKKLYQSTTEAQGPIKLPGGGTVYLLPIPAATPTPLSMPAAPQSSSDPGGPFTGSSFAGADLNVSNDSQPPDVAADVSPTQNVQFVNTLGMYVWAKPSLPITSPPTPATISLAGFWCTGSSINGQTQSQCAGGTPPSGYRIGDTQIGYDPWLGRWIATTLLFATTPNSSTPNYVYMALSNSGTLTGTGTDLASEWTKWSVSVCQDNPGFPFADQPLLGWGTKVVGVDVVCFDAAGVKRGEDNLLVLNNATLTATPPPALPGPIVPPCIGMTPARNEDAANLSDLILLASVVPGDAMVPEPAAGTCGVNTANESPYVVEYEVTGSSRVVGSHGFPCTSGKACSPLSESPPFFNPGLYSAGNAAQLGCNAQGCTIDANQARIEAAPIRESQHAAGSHLTKPVLTLGFATGYQSSDNMTGSQAIWVQQLVPTNTANSWVAEALTPNGFWTSYPTTTIDNDFDLYLASTWFEATSYPFTVWDLYGGTDFGSTGFGNRTFEGQDIIERSSKEYTGDSNPDANHQRWGDYNTMVYDPSTIGPGGEPVFWTVEETTCSSFSQALPQCSGSGTTSDDESTTWVALQDPAPFFVGPPSDVETEVPSNVTCSTPSYTQSALVSPPSGVQAGDVLIANLIVGGPTPDTTPTLPPGWTLLNMSNVGTSGSTTMTIPDTCGFSLISQVAVHTFSTSDTTPYNFSFQMSPVQNTTCPGGGCFLGESGVYLNDYRFAGTDFTKYGAFGFPNGDTGSNNTSATTAITIPAERKVLTVFSGLGDLDDFTQGNPCETFSEPSGTPALTIESSLTPDCSVPAFLSTDLWSNAGGTVGPYIESPGSLQNGGDSPLPAWQVAIPEPNQ